MEMLMLCLILWVKCVSILVGIMLWMCLVLERLRKVLLIESGLISGVSVCMVCCILWLMWIYLVMLGGIMMVCG